MSFNRFDGHPATVGVVERRVVAGETWSARIALITYGWGRLTVSSTATQYVSPVAIAEASDRYRRGAASVCRIGGTAF
jgi:hypothetical protein